MMADEKEEKVYVACAEKDPTTLLHCELPKGHDGMHEALLNEEDEEIKWSDGDE